MILDVTFEEQTTEIAADFEHKVELNYLIAQSVAVKKSYAISNSSTVPPTLWDDEAPTPTTDKPYLWVKTNTTYTVVDGTTYKFSDNGVVVGVCGADGYTPVKGKDYFTDADIESVLDLATPERIGARPNDWMPTAADVGARPNTWMPTANQVGAATPADVKKAFPVNLLDNSDFRNPVNQRGITSATGYGVYTFDRWVIDSSNGNGYWDVKPNVGCGLNVNGDIWMVFVQRIVGLDRTKPYTIAFQDGYGNIHINESADIQWFDDFAEARIILNTGTMTVVWAALYEGEYTAETLPEYHPKGYGAEMVECLRYYRRKNAVVEGTNGYASINFDITMRCVPTCAVISTNGGATFYEAGADYIAFSNCEFALEAVLYEASADL